MSSILPESAPFSPEQRAWLSGFFSGLIGVQPQLDPSIALAAAGISAPSIDGTDQPPEAQEEEDFPWHDESLSIDERMELADGKPVERRLMAAMAQLDCGSCGYVCKTYSEAIASGEETNLTLCSPGGKETKQMIKLVLKDSGGVKSAAPRNGTPSQAAGWSRQNPFSAKLSSSICLNGEGSAKDTRHVEIDLTGSGLQYHVGDALGVYPTNCRDLATAILGNLRIDPELSVEAKSGGKQPLIEAIVNDYCLKDPSDELLELLVTRMESSDLKQQLEQYLNDGVPEGVDVLDILELCQGPSITAAEFVETLGPLNPRLYSIASSQKQVGDHVHLTVGKVTYQRNDRLRKGVASTMLAERVDVGETVRVFVQPNHGGFTVPTDPSAKMIMVGPGTGIAPFVAFLQERIATSATGENWLFFGDQHEACDFLYRSELEAYLKFGSLTRLDTAFSRDGDAKVYVQDRMREQAAELWRWLDSGAYFFVCGDASRMAADVDQALVDIAAEQGGMSAAEAKAYIDQLKKDQRYVRDVY